MLLNAEHVRDLFEKLELVLRKILVPFKLRQHVHRAVVLDRLLDGFGERLRPTRLVLAGSEVIELVASEVCDKCALVLLEDELGHEKS